MAPPSRPIIAISADGSRTTYNSKRAASSATGIAAASVALAAANLAMRDGFIWKFADDPRDVDMGRFTTNQAPVAAPTEAAVEQARAFVDALRGDDGELITEMRLSDGFISATKMCQSAGKMWGHYNVVDGHVAFMNALATSLATSRDALVQSITDGPLHGRGTWVHPKLAINLAQWCSPVFAVKVGELVFRYLSGRVTTEESRAAARTVIERAAPQGTEDETRTLKRQRLLNEIELENVKHATEMAKAQSSLLDTLAAGVAPPAMTGMINIARNNLTIKCLAALNKSGSTASLISPEPPTRPVTVARRVSVQEFGRDFLGLRGNDLSTARLSVVGKKLGRNWKNLPGKGEVVGTISDAGEKQWKRTFLEDGATRTAVFTGPLDNDMLANNRLKHSAAYLGTNEIGNGQAYDVWTYQLDQVEDLMREAFQ
jgi:hypothetical protein